MLSIQINLLLEKDFLHKCCETRKQFNKREENMNAVFVLIVECKF